MFFIFSDFCFNALSLYHKNRELAMKSNKKSDALQTVVLQGILDIGLLQKIFLYCARAPIS